MVFQLSACEYEGIDGYGEYGTANVSPMVERWRNDVVRIAAKMVSVNTWNYFLL